MRLSKKRAQKENYQKPTIVELWAISVLIFSYKSTTSSVTLTVRRQAHLITSCGCCTEGLCTARPWTLERYLWLHYQCNADLGLPWWSKEFACRCRGHGFDPGSKKIPDAKEQLSPRVSTTEPHRVATTEARAPRACASQQEKPPQLESSPRWP